jgi:excisionase family DNA binding protein
MNEDKLMSFKQFCKKAEISASTGRRLIASGQLKYIKIGRKILVSQEQFAEFIELNTVK